MCSSRSGSGSGSGSGTGTGTGTGSSTCFILVVVVEVIAVWDACTVVGILRCAWCTIAYLIVCCLAAWILPRFVTPP